MSIFSLLNESSAAVHIKSQNALYDIRQWSMSNQGVALIILSAALIFLALFPMHASATSLSSVAEEWKTTINAALKIGVYIAFAIGVFGILYGCKLVLDKSNDRENVKTGSIVISFVGGAFLCMLSVIVNIMAGSVSSSGNKGDLIEINN